MAPISIRRSITGSSLIRPSASSRSVNPDPTTISSRVSPAAWGSAPTTPRACANWIGSNACSRPLICPGISPGRSLSSADILWCRPRNPKRGPRRPIGGLPKVARRIYPKRCRCPGITPNSFSRVCRPSQASSNLRARALSDMRPMIPSGPRSLNTPRPGKVRGFPNWPRIRCS